MNTKNICNICGANYEYKDGKWCCPACGAIRTEEISNEEEMLLYNAAQKLRLSDFDEAEELYRDVVEQYPKNSRGYWGLVLAKYGIKYEKDYNGKMIPSCYATSYESILGDANYKKVLQYADKDSRAYYETQARRIEAIRREWVEKAEREEPYDIFISYKDSDKENGIDRTPDSYDAYELYSKLKEKGYRVFFSRESLAGKEGERYEPYIFNALNTAQVMIIYGTKPEYIESTWVKNEWIRYYKRIRSGQKQENSLLLAYKGFSPSKLPKPLCDIQGFDLGKITVGIGDLEVQIESILSAARMQRKIKRVNVKNREKRSAEQVRRLDTVAVGKVMPAVAKRERERISTRSIGCNSMKLSVTAEKNLALAENYLARRQFAEAEERFDEILQSSPRNGRALIGKFLAQIKVQNITALENNGLQSVLDTVLIEKVLANAEKESAEIVLKALCAEASSSFVRGDLARTKLIVSLVRDYESPTAEKLRGELYEYGLRLIANDEESAKYFLDVHLSLEENEEVYVRKLHVIVNKSIEYAAYSLAGYYADKLKKADANNYETQLSILEIQYRTRGEAEVLRCIDREKTYQKIEGVLSKLDTESAEKWLQACFSQIAALLRGGVYAGALRWIEICAKYQFGGRKELLESLLTICQNNASMRSSECFEAVLTYVADGNSAIYAERAKEFADAALKAKEFDAAKLYYGKVFSVKPDSIPAARGKFFADIRCASEKELPMAIVNLSEWSCFEEVLIVQTEAADDLKWIEKLANACIENIRKVGQSVSGNVFRVFDKLLSYISEEFESALLQLLKRAAELCLKEGLFEQSQKYYETYISEDAESSDAYWGLLQAKLKCRNEEELIRTSEPISQFSEFENAQVCVADDKAVLNHYIDVREKQSKHIKAVQKRRSLIRLGSIFLSIIFVVAAALLGWFTYFNNQNQLLYNAVNDGYEVSAGKFYETEGRLVIPAEHDGKAVVAIGNNAFAGHAEINEIVLPASIESIGVNAFASCVNLKSVVFTADVSARVVDTLTALREIGDGAFSGCVKLETVDLPYGVERIGAQAFAGTSLTEVTVPNTVNYIGDSAFDGCDSLRTIIVGNREKIPADWTENWKDNCNATVEFRLRVVFDYNGSTMGDDLGEQYIVYGEKFAFPIPERKGYTFDGWFRDETRLTDTKGQSISEWQYEDGGTVAAQWAPNVNNIIFNANGGTGDMPTQNIATDKYAQLSTNTFTRKGYTFAGWAENATGTVVYKDGAEYTMGTESSYELFAVWIANRNEIVFDGNGATGGSMKSQFMTTDSSSSLTENSFVKAGYKFVGWAESESGEVKYFDGANYSMGTEAKYILYAVWKTAEYTIRYNLNNGTENENPDVYTIESEDIILKAPTRAGYRFTGWTGTELSKPTLSVTIKMGSTGNRDYTANWEANVNRIVFHACGGDGEMYVQNICTDEVAPLYSNQFTRNGYTFAGWAKNEGGRVFYSNEANYTMGAESEYHLYAVWSTIEYSIRYTLNGGSVHGNPYGYTIESDTFRIENPVRAGYTFAGWTGTDLEEPSLLVNVVRGSVGNREYTAVWEANVNKVIFHANGGEGDMPAQDINTDASAALSENTFTRLGYTFIGWTTSENGKVIFADGDTYIMGTEKEYHLYAVWETIYYTIEYKLNGGIENENPTTFTVVSSEFTLNAPVRAGYTFIGWSGTGIDGMSVTVTLQTGSTGDRDYVANWKANDNKIIFHANGGDGEMLPQTIKTDMSTSLNENVFVRNGYTFVGWATNSNGEVVYEDGAEYPMGTAAEYHLFAVWNANLNTIQFNANCADSGEMAAQVGYTDSEMVLPLNAYQRKGYQFIGWAKEKDGDVVYKDGAQIVVGAEPNITFFAKWKALSYKVTLVFEDKNITETDVVYDAAYSFVTPERSGYHFFGWYSEPGGGGTKYTDEEGNGTDAWSYADDITLYAYWLGTDCLVYTLGEDDTYSLTGLTDTSLTEVYISEYFDGKPVTKIVANAFANGKSITGIVVPASMQTIEKGAFAGCTALRTLTLPFVGNSRTAEGEAALLGWLFSDTHADGCMLVYQYYSEYGMAVAYIPDSLANVVVTDAENIGYGAFSSVTSLQRVSITANVLGDRAFYDCASLADIELSNGITAIGQSAFARCVALTELSIPNSIQSIGRYAFDECSALTSLTLPFVGANAQASGAEGALGYLFGNVSSADMVLVNQSNVGVQAYFPARLANLTVTNATQIPTGALRGLTMLKNIAWNDGITSLGDYALYDCTGVTSLTFPSSLQKIGNYALYNASVSVLELPQSVLSLGAYALYGSELRALLVPSSVVVSLGNGALDNTHTALKIYVADSLLNSYKSAWSSYSSRIYSFNCIRENGMAIDGNTLLHYFGEETEIVLPINVISIGAYAFAGTSVRSVLVPGNIHTIGENAFSGCDTLESVRLLSGVRTISSKAFYEATGLKEIEISNTVTEIGASAFYGCASLTEVVVPNSVLSIGSGAFQGCNLLVKMTLPFVGGSRSTNTSAEMTTSSTWDGGSKYLFGYIFGGGLSRVASSSHDSIVYTGSTGWTYQGTSSYVYYYVSAGHGYYQHYIETYYVPISLREVVITDATGISANAFYGCTMLTSITLNEGITTINEYAFYGCDNLTEIAIPESVTSIGSNAFAECSQLQIVQVRRGDVISLTSLGSNVFDSTPATLLILVPDHTYSAYTSATNWVMYTDKIRLISDTE